MTCLSLQFVYYFLLSYDGQREIIFSILNYLRSLAVCTQVTRENNNFNFTDFALDLYTKLE